MLTPFDLVLRNICCNALICRSDCSLHIAYGVINSDNKLGSDKIGSIPKLINVFKDYNNCRVLLYIYTYINFTLVLYRNNTNA